MMVVGRAAVSLVVLIFIIEFLLYVKRLGDQILRPLLSDVRWQALRCDVVQLLMVDEHFGW